MSQDKIFAQGMIVKDRGNAPEWMIAKVSIKVEEFIQTLQQNADNGWVNIQLKVSQGGKSYAEIDTWKPNSDNSACTGYTTKVQAPQAPAPFPTQEPDNFPGLEAGSEETPDIPF